MNVTNDYLRVSDIAKEKKITKRTVRNKIQKLLGIVAEGKIIKDRNDEWRIHQSIKEMFKPERIHRVRYSAITIDPVYNYTVEDLKKIMGCIIDEINENDFEVNYTIEKKKANGRNHLHLYVAKKISAKFMKSAKKSFPKISYYLLEVFDLEGWKAYMQSEMKIITIRK